MAFTKKLLRVTFTLGQGTFAESGTDTLTLEGLRTRAQVAKAGALTGSKLDLSVYGMSLSQMNDLSTLGMQIQFIARNTVTVQAGDSSGNWSMVYQGAIITAYADLQAMPQAAFRVGASSLGALNVQTATPNSVSGDVDAAALLGILAQRAGLKFESNGVSVIIRDPYLWGSSADQIKDFCQTANIGWGIDDMTLVCWPKNGARIGAAAIVSQETGLVTYPSYTATGILLKTEFNPAIVFQGLIQVKSALVSDAPTKAQEAAGLAANGIWAVAELDHDLESAVPGGSWFSTIYAYNPKYAPPVLPQ